MATVSLDIPALGWTILRAADAVMIADKAHVYAEGGYRIVEYFSGYAIQVSGSDEQVLLSFETYQKILLTIVEPSHWHRVVPREPGAYRNELAKYKKKLLVAIDRMREIDDIPMAFDTLTCSKRGKHCGKAVLWDDNLNAHVCEDHGVLKVREVTTTDLNPFYNVPRLSEKW